jgi:hypothetical protein
VTDLVNRLRDRAYGSKVPDPLLEQAADELVRLHGEVVLWTAAARLTLDEQKTIVDAILVAVAGGQTSTARRLNWLRQRLTSEVPE